MKRERGHALPAQLEGFRAGADGELRRTLDAPDDQGTLRAQHGERLTGLFELGGLGDADDLGARARRVQ